MPCAAGRAPRPCSALFGDLRPHDLASVRRADAPAAGEGGHYQQAAVAFVHGLGDGGAGDAAVGVGDFDDEAAGVGAEAELGGGAGVLGGVGDEFGDDADDVVGEVVEV